MPLQRLGPQLRIDPAIRSTSPTAVPTTLARSIVSAGVRPSRPRTSGRHAGRPAGAASGRPRRLLGRPARGPAATAARRHRGAPDASRGHASTVPSSTLTARLGRPADLPRHRPLDRLGRRLEHDYLRLLDQVLAWREPLWHSEHLGFTHVDGAFLGTMPALPTTQESLELVIERSRSMRERYGHEFLLEHVASPLDRPADLTLAAYLNTLAAGPAPACCSTSTTSSATSTTATCASTSSSTSSTGRRSARSTWPAGSGTTAGTSTCTPVWWRTRRWRCWARPSSGPPTSTWSSTRCSPRRCRDSASTRSATSWTRSGLRLARDAGAGVRRPRGVPAPRRHRPGHGRADRPARRRRVPVVACSSGPPPCCARLPAHRPAAGAARTVRRRRRRAPRPRRPTLVLHAWGRAFLTVSRRSRPGVADVALLELAMTAPVALVAG